MNSVLIIDDDEVDFMIYSRVIKLGKYSEDFTYKSSAESALEYLDSIKDTPEKWPNYMLIDINMPGMDGFRFVEIYTGLYEHKFNSKIYMVSSSDDYRDKDKAKSLKLVNGFFTKPLTIQLAKEIFK